MVVLALLAWPAVCSSAQTLTVDTVGDALKIRAPGFSFLKGDPLARLKDGRSVRVELAAMVLPGPGKSPAATTRRVFALSYDLWEERFAVTTVDARSQAVSHLTMAAAEAWCVEQLAIPVSALGAMGRDLPFWIRLEYRLLDGDSASTPEDSGYTLRALIDALSRRRKTESSPHPLEAGPFRLPPRVVLAAMTRLRSRLIAAFSHQPCCRLPQPSGLRHRSSTAACSIRPPANSIDSRGCSRPPRSSSISANATR